MQTSKMENIYHYHLFANYSLRGTFRLDKCKIEYEYVFSKLVLIL